MSAKQATEVIFSCKRVKQHHPRLTFNNNAVAEVNDQKHLGLTLAKSLCFNKHILEKLSKAKKNVGIIKHLSKYLPLFFFALLNFSSICLLKYRFLASVRPKCF